MSITLTELIREVGQTAVALDRVCSRAGHDLFLEDSDFTPDPNSPGQMAVPQTQSMMLNGSAIDVPKASLRNQSGLQAKTMKLTVSSDVNLEGRQIHIPYAQEEPEAQPQAPTYETVGSFTFRRGSRNNGAVAGFDVYGQQHFGGLLSDTSVTVNNVQHVIAAIFYVNGNHRAVMEVSGSASHAHFANARIKITNPSNSTQTTTLNFNDGNWNNGGVYWVEATSLSWLINLQPHNAPIDVEILALVDIASEIEDQLEPKGNYRSEVLVTFREGLIANSAHLTLEVEFERQDPSEGVALVNDRMNQDLSEQLN